jgi:hypothetical protein
MRNYIIPVDAAIWEEADVRRDGVGIESVLDVMKGRCPRQARRGQYFAA